MGIQIGGLVSGFDWMTMIDKLMAVESRPVILLAQRKDTYQVRYDAWSDLKGKLGALLSSADTLKKAETFTGKAVTSTNETVVTGTADTTAVAGTYNVWVNQLAQAHKVASDSLATANGGAWAGKTITDPLGLTGTVQINAGGGNQSFTFQAGWSLSDIRDQINAQSATLGVKATIVNDRLVVTRNETGSTAIQFTDDATNQPLTKLGIVTDATTNAIKNKLVDPADATLYVDGIQVTSASNTVTGAISGVTLTLKGGTNPYDPANPANSAAPAVVEVRQDADNTVNAVKAFVDAYNAVVNFIADKTGKNAAALQKGATRSAYANDLRQYPLRGDSVVQTLMSRLRSELTGAVNLTTRYTAAWQVGISVPSGVDAAKQGTLTLDEAKLRDALSRDAAAVQKLFAAGTAGGDAADGIATRLYDDVYEYTKANGLVDDTQKTLQDRMKRYDDQIQALNYRLQLMREDLVQRFTAMEQAVSLLQAQGQWLANQLKSAGAGGG